MQLPTVVPVRLKILAPVLNTEIFTHFTLSYNYIGNIFKFIGIKIEIFSN